MFASSLEKVKMQSVLTSNTHAFQIVLQNPCSKREPEKMMGIQNAEKSVFLYGFP